MTDATAPTPTAEQLTVEQRGWDFGDSFIVRAFGHPTQAPRSWTRETLTTAFSLAEGALRIGFKETRVYYRTEDNILVEQKLPPITQKSPA